MERWMRMKMRMKMVMKRMMQVRVRMQMRWKRRACRRRATRVRARRAGPTLRSPEPRTKGTTMIMMRMMRRMETMHAAMKPVRRPTLGRAHTASHRCPVQIFVVVGLTKYGRLKFIRNVGVKKGRSGRRY